MPIAKNLTDQYVDLIKLPSQIEATFKGDIINGELVKPIKPKSLEYLPMTFELMVPSKTPDSEAAFNQNLRLSNAQKDVNYVGVGMVSSDGFFESASDIDLSFKLLKVMKPLTLYINPQDLTRTKGKRSTPNFTGMLNHITEHSGDEQDKLSATGKIGAYFTNKTGLTRDFRNNSFSYQQLMHLFLYYRNNGYIFELKEKSRISLVGAIKISYDSEIWIGHFDSFSMSENAENIYSMDYTFEFTAREHYTI